ncbi:hypothetical protein N177_1029 [Lutibaculum baratangense AMV1]|uniref:Uncharacterized protein n=1 Tax=Lutibaculum baratangense AMV1 TaxID=631454 RepID=V4RSR0_9HYPH|nr:hypothetical protein N177_1029 [Lutibaculum baratangense AMV1]
MTHSAKFLKLAFMRVLLVPVPVGASLPPAPSSVIPIGT